jgi:hypothetical protein
MVKENAGLQRLAQADLVDILLFLVMFEIFGFPSYLDIFFASAPNSGCSPSLIFNVLLGKFSR